MSKYHFIGIKGSGMSSLAQIVYDMGHQVQGSDEETYFFTQEKLEQRNIPMFSYGVENIKEGYEIILGNAFNDTHIEYTLTHNSLENFFLIYHLSLLLEHMEKLLQLQ